MLSQNMSENEFNWKRVCNALQGSKDTTVISNHQFSPPPPKSCAKKIHTLSTV